MRESRSRPFTERYRRLVDMVGDPYVAEMMWIYYGESAIEVFDAPLKAINGDRKWWAPWKKKNTIRSLIMTTEGKKRVWQMLHDAGAWLP